MHIEAGVRRSSITCPVANAVIRTLDPLDYGHLMKQITLVGGVSQEELDEILSWFKGFDAPLIVSKLDFDLISVTIVQDTNDYLCTEVP